MSSKDLTKALQDEKLKGLSAGEFAKATKENDGLEWLRGDSKPIKVTLITNRG